MQSLKTKGNDNLLGLRLQILHHTQNSGRRSIASNRLRRRSRIVQMPSLYNNADAMPPRKLHLPLHSTEKHLKTFRVDSAGSTADAMLPKLLKAERF